MEVIICDTAETAGEIAAARVARECVGKAEPVLGFATGSSPLAIYAQLAEWVAEGKLDLSQAHGFALDEYVGMPKEHPESYWAVIDRTVTKPLRMNPDRVHVPDGRAEDLANAGAEYERKIKAAGGVDVQILGIGSNGHIGFNEPTSSLSSRTRIKTLTERTRLDNQRFFDSLDEVPTHCLTQGLGTILDAEVAILVASGDHKARAVADMIEGPVCAVCPGSVLQLHEHATVIVDEAAASELRFSEYYRHVYDRLPDWQRIGPANWD